MTGNCQFCVSINFSTYFLFDSVVGVLVVGLRLVMSVPRQHDASDIHSMTVATS